MVFCSSAERASEDIQSAAPAPSRRRLSTIKGNVFACLVEKNLKQKVFVEFFFRYDDVLWNDHSSTLRSKKSSNVVCTLDIIF